MKIQVLLIIITVFTTEVLYSQQGSLDANENSVWYDGKTLTMEGKGWTNTNAYYECLPGKAEGKVLRTIYKKLVADGVEQLYFLSNKGMLGTDGEATVDGTHPSDLGMVRMSVVFTDYLRKFIR